MLILPFMLRGWLSWYRVSGSCGLVMVNRLQDEKKVYELICAVQKYLETREGENRDVNLCRIYIRRIEHLYYKVSTEIVARSLCQMVVTRDGTIL